jgi:hypothetical protein
VEEGSERSRKQEGNKEWREEAWLEEREKKELQVCSKLMKCIE